MKKENKNFNILINGVGGQGLITLLGILAQAALKEGFDVKSSELHGLAQRGGSVEVHLKFGKKVFSPLVAKGKADFVLSLETQEALVVSYYASKNAGTVFLVNKFRTPTLSETIDDEKVLSDLKKISGKVVLVPATEFCQKEFENPVVAGIFMLGLASFREFIPFKPSVLSEAIKSSVPEKYLELNLKAFNAAKDYKI